ncbi:hypothetical protein [Streptomyces shenzhenensis]|uniref:hypothetical protein n=1 Tax=Streptomyces shenzhenensis TaxID=943815 RepID=UPI001F38D0B5|nr:hypothetical protein [Streptomyces shenzhenensis]
MPFHFATVNRKLAVSMGGRTDYAVLAMAWNDETNEMRYLIAAKERPIWVNDQELVRVSTGDE